VNGVDAGFSVFNADAFGRREVQFLGCQQKVIGRGLGASLVAAGDDTIEVSGDSQSIDHLRCIAAGRNHCQLQPGFSGRVEQIHDAGEQRFRCNLLEVLAVVSVLPLHPGLCRGLVNLASLEQTVERLAPPRFTLHVSRFTFHASRFTLHVSRFTLHVSRFTFHVSRFTFHASRFTDFPDGLA
jgi:hypothetical protein